MTLEQFIKDFASQLDDTDLNEVTAETKFKELEEWSSVEALLIIVMADEKYHARINRDDIVNSQTIKDLFERVKSKCNSSQ